MNQQGRLNFADLDNYTIGGAGLDQGTQYWENAVAELIASRQATGVIYGGGVTVVAALTVRVAAGLALFSNGKMVAWDQQDVALTAANGANPRYDRIELTYSLDDNDEVENNDLETKVLDKIHVATASALAGVAAGSPVAPVRTAGTLSLAIVHVAALQVALTSPDIDLTEDSARDLSYTLLGTSPYGIRFNSRLGVLQASTDGAIWKSFGNIPAKVITFADSPYTVTPAQPNIEVNTAGGAVTVNLPALASAFPVEVTKISADANEVTVDASAAETINDDLTDTLAQKYDNKVYKPLSIGWVIR